ncbi:hypothetical protein IWQ60_009061, partial [Tieghemiomyces parasiticus]
FTLTSILIGIMLLLQLAVGLALPTLSTPPAGSVAGLPSIPTNAVASTGAFLDLKPSESTPTIVHLNRRILPLLAGAAIRSGAGKVIGAIGRKLFGKK